MEEFDDGDDVKPGPVHLKHEAQENLPSLECSVGQGIERIFCEFDIVFPVAKRDQVVVFIKIFNFRCRYAPHIGGFFAKKVEGHRFPSGLALDIDLRFESAGTGFDADPLPAVQLHAGQFQTGFARVWVFAPFSFVQRVSARVGPQEPAAFVVIESHVSRTVDLDPCAGDAWTFTLVPVSGAVLFCGFELG